MLENSKFSQTFCNASILHPLSDKNVFVYPDRIVIGEEEILFDDKGGLTWVTAEYDILDIKSLSFGIMCVVAGGLKRSKRLVNGGFGLLGWNTGEQIVRVTFNFRNRDFIQVFVMGEEYEVMEEAICKVTDSRVEDEYEGRNEAIWAVTDGRFDGVSPLVMLLKIMNSETIIFQV